MADCGEGRTSCTKTPAKKHSGRRKWDCEYGRVFSGSPYNNHRTRKCCESARFSSATFLSTSSVSNQAKRTEVTVLRQRMQATVSRIGAHLWPSPGRTRTATPSPGRAPVRRRQLPAEHDARCARRLEPGRGLHNVLRR